jgi:hypothetical protein
MDTESLIAHAQRVADVQALENEAREALARWLSQSEELPRGLKASDIAASFQRCALVFGTRTVHGRTLRQSFGCRSAEKRSALIA